MTDPSPPDPPPSGPSGNPNRRWRRLSAALLVLFGFGAGIVAAHLGQFLHHRARSGDHRGARDEGRRGGRTPGEARERARDEDRSRGRERRFRDHLHRELDLSEDQREQLDAFLAANRAEARAFWDDTYARYHELRLRFREQIREILGEDQRERFTALIERLEERGRRRDADRAPGRGPPPEPPS